MTTNGIVRSESPANTTDTSTHLATDKLGADKATFLKLLVAQLKNQDPLNPQDGAQFVSQLAQFTAVEQSSQMSTDITAIRKLLTEQTA